MKDPVLTQLRRQLKTEAPATLAKPGPARTAAVADDTAELDDQALFARATRGAQRLHAPPPPPRPARRPRPDEATLLRRQVAEGMDEREQAALSDMAALMQPVAAEAVLAFMRPGVQRRQFDKLRSGQLPWRHAVDLHGCTLEQAREAVLQLLDEAARDQIQVVKIVHGKGLNNGHALLKTAVNGWLRQLPSVIAFASADARNGGTGAVLVLLRRERPTEL